MQTVKVNWSGGKDSTAAALLYLSRPNKYKVIIVHYTPFFDEETPLILPKHYNFIKAMARRFEDMGATVICVTGKTYKDFCTHIITRGKNKGKMQGFPYWGRGCCNFRNTKISALKSVKICYDIEDIGIAADEYDRLNQIRGNVVSILYDNLITENEAFDICIKNNALSPHYEEHRRDGCALCPNAKAAEREEWLNSYPNAREKLKELQEICMKKRPELYPLRNNKLFI